MPSPARSRTGLTRREVFSLVCLAALAVPALASLLAALTVALRTRPTAVPLPLPVYEIESVSGNHRASLLNLPLGQPGVLPQAPIPVDIDGDLLPDVTVAVNLVNVDGLLLNPPQPGQVLAPNIEINRLVTAPVLGQPAKPLRINVKLTIKDVQGTQPDTIVRFGYDTGPGGSIPTYWKAKVAGLERFFNPFQAVIDTEGQDLGLSPGISDFRLAPTASPYQGPLSIIGGVEGGDSEADLDLRYSPFPGAVQVTYGSDSAGAHATYAHGAPGEVDLAAKVRLDTKDQVLDATARIDRIPRAISVDFGGDLTGGSMDFRTRPDGRLPDVGVDVVTTPKKKAEVQTPLVAHADIEALSAHLHGEWNVNTDAGEAHAAFTGAGAGIGAVEASVANFAGAPQHLVPWVPEQQQYLSFEQVPKPGGGGTEQLIRARVERVRTVTFDQDGGGYRASAGIGDGELPLQAHVTIDLRPEDGPLVDAEAQISPLPDHIELGFSPPGDDPEDEPLVARYAASQTVDVDVDAEVRLPAAAAGAACGANGTVCARLGLRNIPATIEARVFDGLTAAGGHRESRIEVDQTPRPGGVVPDLTADVTLGQDDTAPLVAHAEVDGLSRHLRVRTLQGANQTLQRLELHTCDRRYEDLTCAPGSEDEIGSVRFAVKDFLERPANLPPPTSSAPLFAGVTARGDLTRDDLVRFEAVGRVTNIREVQYVNDGDAFGVKTRIGGGKDLVVDVDGKDLALSGITPAGTRADVAARALVSPLPDDMTFCFRRADSPLSASSEPVTAACNTTNPFGDGTVTSSPLTLAFRSSAVFRTEVEAGGRLDQGTRADAADDIRAAARLKVERIPKEITARVGTPKAGTDAPIRILTTAPAGADIDLNVHGELAVGGASCNEPDPAGDLACADLDVDDLPLNLSALVGGGRNGARAEFHACDYRFFAATPGCAAAPGEIKALTADGKVVLGEPGALGALDPETDMHALLQARMPSADDIAFRARGRFERIRSVFFRQAADGFDASYELGDGVKPFEAKVQADTRSGIGGREPTGLALDGKARLTPLPSRVTVGQHGPGDGRNAAPMVLAYDASSDVDLDAFANVVSATSPARATCGAPATACATLDVDNLPAKLVATVGTAETGPGGDSGPLPPGPAGSVDHRTTIKTSYANASSADKIDVRAEAVLGLPSTTPLTGATPLRAKVDLLGLPRYVTAVLDEHVTGPGTPREGRDLRRVAVQTCDVQSDGTCRSGTEDQLDTLHLEAGTYLTRPLGMPAPGAGIASPLWAHVVGRGNDFQAGLHLRTLREIQYVSDATRGLTAARARIGQDDELTTKVDVLGLPLGPQTILGSLAVDDPTLDIQATAVIQNLPDTVGLCLRSSGKPVPASATGNAVTAPCEDADPFEDGEALPHSPLSVAYRASDPIRRISVDAAVTTNGKHNARPGNPAIEPRKLAGSVTVDDVPAELTLHVLTPADDAAGNPKGATKVRYEAPNQGGPGMTIGLRAAETVGDAVCQDPRPTATALCVGATLRDLPQKANLRWDPQQQADNFELTTDSTSPGGAFSLDDLELSSVKPRLGPGAVPVVPATADVLILTGAVRGIDHRIEVNGNLGLPTATGDTGAVDLRASVRIGEITAAVKNFVAPNPFVGVIPARPVHNDPASPWVTDPSLLQTATFRQRGEAFLAEASIKQVAGFGYRAVTDTAGNATGTSVVTVDFAKDFAARAYADIAPDETTRILGDVLLEDIPAGLSFCFRGARTGTPTVAAAQASYCDDPGTGIRPEDGAFQFLGTAATPELNPLDPNGLDVDAFVRVATNGTDILSGRLDIADIPYRLEGAIPAGGGRKLDVAAKKRNGTADGINEIKFAFATFDLPPDVATTPASIPVELRSGYTVIQPGYSPITTAKAPFPPKVEAGQYLSAVSAFGDVEVAGRLGGFGGPASRLQRILYDPEPCPNPGGRTDYPFFPRTDGSTYTCVRADLQQTSATPDPLAVSAISRDETGAEVRLTNAGINDLPAYIQLTLSETDKTGPGDSDVLRRRCRSNQVETAGKTAAQIAAVTDCMPPLVRFDQPLDSARVFGVLEAGKPEDLSFLNAVSARETLADTMALPTPAAWADWADGGNDPRGVRVRLAEREGRTAVRASLRLPIPASLTVAHPQSTENEQADATAYYTASDTRFSYVVRTSTGAPVASLGEMAGLIQQADGTQILIGKPCAKLPQERKWSLDEELGKFNFLPDIQRYDCNGDLRRGVPIPGEVGLSLYDRTNKKTGSSFLRVDGRVSTPISAGIRLLGGDPTGIGRLEAEVKDVPGAINPATGQAYQNIGPDDATFRLQHMSLGEGEDPPESGGGGGGGEAVDEPCIFCTETNVRLASVFASFDFQPEGASQPARRVDATLRSDGLKNGLEVKSTNAVVGGVPTPVRVVADAKVDPLDFRAYLDLVPLFDQAALDLENFIKNDLGLPGWIASVIGFVVKIVLRLIASLVNVRVELQSKLEAGLDIMTSHLQFRQNLFHVKAQVDDGRAQLGPFDLYVKQLEAFASVGARIPLPWPLPDITIGFTLLSVYYLPAFSDLIPFDLKFINCNNAVTAIVDNFLPNAPPPFFPNSFEATPGDPANIVIWPFRDARMSYGGLLGPLVQLGAMLAGPFFCLAGVSNEDIPLGEPGDPVGEGLWAGHRVFDSALLDPSTLSPGAPAAAEPPDAVPAPPAPPAPAPLPEPEPDYTLVGDLALCGVIDVGTLTVPSGRTLRVATAADPTVTIPSRSGQPAKPSCAAADVGSLTIVANRIVNNGTIDATGTSTAARQPQGGDNPVFAGTPPAGNGGGGHHGAGGNGSQGSGGQAYANPDGRTSSVTETGVPGAGTGRGNGGGALQLLVSPRPTRPDPAQVAITYVDGDIQSTGTIRANGTDAAGNFSGTCGVLDNPSTEANEAVPLSGVHGPGGGGSGGGIVLAASRLSLSGPVEARGGAGGFGRLGGGGGGGGGVVKLLAPVQVLTGAFSVNVGGGALGGACTTGNLPNPAPFIGSAGGIGDRVDVARPLGRAQETADFWNRGTVRVPVRAEGSYSGASPSGFTVYVCGIRTTAGAPPADPDPDDDDVPTLADNYTVPTTNSAGSPCGTGGGTQQLASKSFSVFSIEPTAADGFVNLPLSGAANDGYWGVWAAVVRGADVSKPPTEVHTVFGVDNTAPTVAITAPAAGFETREVGVTLAFDQADPAASGDPSGLAATECRNDGPATTTQFAACAPGGTFNLTPGDGDKRIRVRVRDVAGNTAEATVQGKLSNSPPTAVASVSAGPDGTNGFYRTAPSFTVNGYSQSQGIPAHASQPVFWRFDDLPEQACALPCTIPASEFAKLPPGDHALFFSAQDRLGNRLFGDEMQRFPAGAAVLRWDPNAPRSELTLVPRLADAEFPAGTGWFTDRPLVVLSAIDGFGESGMQRIEQRVDGVGGFTAYTGPFELAPGIHSIEWRGVDRAGNVQAVQTRSGIRVDDVAPDVDITVTGGTAGLNGWYTSAPTISVGGYADNTGGVGAPVAGRIRHRVDNGAEQSCSPSCTLPGLGTGTHLIGAHGVDAVGNAGSEAEADGNVTVKVDGEAPSTQISIRSLVPDGVNGWHRSSLPWVTLTGLDQPAGYGRVLAAGSGVALTERSLDGGATWAPYTGPFAVSGGQVVCARSTDVAGNVEAQGSCRTVKGDDVKPTVGLSVSGTPGLAGWYVGPATVTVTSGDTGGSGLGTPGATGTPCWWTPPAGPVPAGTCASIDGRPFVAVSGPLALGEGRHEVRAFSVDSAGNRSDVAVTLVDIDLSPAKAALRTVPPSARATGWFRTNPRLFLRTVDGAQGSGVARTELSLDGGATWATYTGPASIPAGRRVVAFRTVDVAGLASAPVTVPLDIDVTPPTVRATSAEPTIWLRLVSILGNLLGLSPSQAKLKWEISDDLAPSASVKVLVYNQTGNVVRVLDGGNHALTPGVTKSGHTLWDGKDQSLTGIVPLGLYYYRVVVTDAAGNVSQSGESRPITIKVG